MELDKVTDWVPAVCRRRRTGLGKVDFFPTERGGVQILGGRSVTRFKICPRKTVRHEFANSFEPHGAYVDLHVKELAEIPTNAGF